MNKKGKILFSAAVMVVLSFVCLIACNKDETESSSKNIEMTDADKSSITESDGMNFMRIYAHCDDVQGGFTFNENGELESDEHTDLGVVKTFEGEMTPKIDVVKVGKHFPKFIKEFHQTNDYLITCFETHFFEDREMIQIEYVLNHDFNNPESAMYVLSPSADSKDITKPVLIKCNGSCNTSSEKCTEVYNLNTGEVSCGCQSDECSMHIEPAE